MTDATDKVGVLCVDVDSVVGNVRPVSKRLARLAESVSHKGNFEVTLALGLFYRYSSVVVYRH